MKLCKLDLIAFGPFEKHTLELSGGDVGLDVIYGDNEEGKSTTLRAIRSLLYGIDERPRDAHRFESPRLRVGGTLRRKSGEELAVVRRKARKSTLLMAGTEEPLPDDVLDPFLGGVDRAEFERKFGIDYEELVNGGGAILEQSGDIGRVLYSAATGTASVKKLLEQLEKEADALFRPRGSATEIYKLVSAHAENTKKAKESSLGSTEWTKLLQEREEVVRQLATLDDQKHQLERERARLERVKRVRPMLGRRQQLRVDLAAMGSVVDLAEDFEAQRRDVTNGKRAADTQAQKNEAERKRLDAAAAVPLPYSLLERSAEIEVLGRRLGSYETDKKDGPALESRRRQDLNNGREKLKAIASGLDIEKVDELRPLLPLDKIVQRLASQQAELATEERRLQHERKQLAEKLGHLHRKQAEADEKRDPKQLATAIRDAQRAGDLDGQIQEQSEICESLTERCGRDLACLGLWKGTEEEFERLALPGLETVTHYEEQFAQLEKRRQRNAEKQSEAVSAQKQIAAKISTLERNGQVPTAEDLQQRRQHRDEGWDLVRGRYIDKQKSDKDVRKYAADRPIEDVYEEAVRSADEVADRLRWDAGRVQKRELLEEESATHAHNLKEAKEGAKEIAAMSEALQGEWQEVWATTAIDPRSPKEMAGWLAKVGKSRENFEQLHTAQRELSALTKRRATAIKSLASHLEALGETLDPVARDQLGLALDRAQAVVETVKSGLAQRKELESTASEVKRELERVEDEIKSLQERRDQWQRDWDDAARGFGFLDDSSVTRVQIAIDQLRDLFGDVDKAEEIKRRIYGIDKRTSDFEKKVDDFAAVIGRPRGNQPIDQYVVGLGDALTKAREVESQLKIVCQQRQALETDELETRAKLKDAEERLAELRRQAKTNSDDDLQAAGQRSDQTRTLRLQITSLEEAILQAGDSRDLDELSAEAQGIDLDDLEAQIAHKEDMLAQLDQERSRTLRREGELTNQIAANDGSAAAAEASEQAELALAEMRDKVRRYLSIRAATLILKSQIENYRQQNQEPVLKRAGELFAKLTLGSFNGLRGDVDDDGTPALMGVRPDDKEVDVEGMSDGTRDQLYLALRLATLERGLDHGEPLPLIVDDILVGFDDDRTRACLEVLAELAKRTQVIVFTHHAKVAEIARSLDLRAGVAVREMRANGQIS
jgi:uncharacterized protein YhaN